MCVIIVLSVENCYYNILLLTFCVILLVNKILMLLRIVCRKEDLYKCQLNESWVTARKSLILHYRNTHIERRVFFIDMTVIHESKDN